jgi:hypothetical protein
MLTVIMLCRVLFIVMINVNMLNVVLLNVVIMNVVMLSVVAPMLSTRISALKRLTAGIYQNFILKTTLYFPRNLQIDLKS